MLRILNNYLPNLLFLEFKNSDNQKIYEIELDKDKKAIISLNAVISFSDKMLQQYRETDFLNTAYLFLTVETPETKDSLSYYVSQQYIEVPMTELIKKKSNLAQINFTTPVQSEITIGDELRSFNKLNFKLSVTLQGPGHAGISLEVENGIFFNTMVNLKG